MATGSDAYGRLLRARPARRPLGHVKLTVLSALALVLIGVPGLGGLAAARPADAGSGANAAWARVASPPTPHGGGHSATPLNDGKVLVAGGGTGTRTASADLYDPESGSWSPTGAMAVARAEHTATLLADGRVLVAGGVGNNDLSAEGYLGSAEVYDPATRTWSPAGSLPVGRLFHTATLLPDGRVLVAGGMAAPTPGDKTLGFQVLDSSDLFDPTTGSWSPAGSMTIGRADHTATLLPDGTVLVAGGRDGELNPSTASAETYDPAARSWTVVPRLMATARARHTATLLRDGSVLLVGGTRLVSGPARVNDAIQSSAERYEPRRGSFQPAPSLAQARLAHFAVRLPDDTVLVAAGVGGAAGTAPLASAQRFDPDMDRWGPPRTMSVVSKQESVTVLAKDPCGDQCGSVLLLGGETRDEAALYQPPKLVPSHARPADGRNSAVAALAIGGAGVGALALAVVRWRRRGRTSRSGGRIPRR